MASFIIPRSSTSIWILRPTNQTSQHKHSWSLLLAFLLFLLAVIVISVIARLLADYLLRRHPETTAAARRARRPRPAPSAGLDGAAVASLPTFAYRSAGAAAGGGGESQCAVCLSAPEEGETMRALPNCKHFFHARCIDTWLRAHPTCPTCRADVRRRKGESGGRLLASPAMPARGGGVSGGELAVVKEGSSGSRMGSSFCRRLSMGRRRGEGDDEAADLERGVI